MREEVLVRYWTERLGRFEFKWNTDKRRGTSRGDHPKLTSTTSPWPLLRAQACSCFLFGTKPQPLCIMNKALRSVKHCNGLSYHAVQTVLLMENSLSSVTGALVQLGIAGHITQILGFSTSRI
ncbi:unnamed protein product [Coregonus sp. 'balchen']|nr:unnamed protein product [Coregonus sp. 'balchen']